MNISSGTVLFSVYLLKILNYRALHL